MNLLALFTRLDGRISRKPFWMAFIIFIVVIVVGSIAIFETVGDTAFDGPYSGYSAISLVFSPLLLIASFPFYLKRLHDLNRSFALLWPAVIIEALSVPSALFGILGDADGYNAVGWASVVIDTVYSLALLIYLGCFRGTRGPNDYGDDPLEQSADDTASKAISA